MVLQNITDDHTDTVCQPVLTPLIPSWFVAYKQSRAEEKYIKTPFTVDTVLICDLYVPMLSV